MASNQTVAPLIKQRSMSESDIDAVLVVEQKANRFAWSKQNFVSCFREGYHNTILQDDADQLLGFIITQVIVDELHLLNICVSPAYQGLGYGKQLLQMVIDQAKEMEASVVLLEVRKSNHRAQQLYLSAGFNEISVRRGYYPAENGREDAVLMALDLSYLQMFD